MVKKLAIGLVILGALAFMADQGKRASQAAKAPTVELLSAWEPRVAGGGERVSVRGPVSETEVSELIAARGVQPAEVFVYDAGQTPGTDRPAARYLSTKAGLQRLY